MEEETRKKKYNKSYPILKYRYAVWS